MATPDAAVKEFMSDKKNFADAYNLFLFQKNLVDPNRLEQLNPNLVSVLFGDQDKKFRQSVERTLDDMMKAMVLMDDGRITYLMLGSQYQIDVHNAMPVRNLLESGLLYAQQVKEIGRRNQELSRSDPELRRQLNRSGAFLSGVLPTDRLHPVIILVMYFGEQEWDGPLSLREMLTEADQEFLKYSCDYKINLVTPQHIPELPEGQDSELWKLMTVLAAGRKRGKNLLSLAGDRRFESVSNNTVRLINTLLKTNIRFNQTEGGEINMCSAWKEIQAELAEKERLSQENDRYRQENSRYQQAVMQKDREIERLRAIMKQNGLQF